MRSTTLLSSAAALAGVALSEFIESDSAYCASKMSSFLVWADQVTTPAPILSFIATRTDVPPPVRSFDPAKHIAQVCSIRKALPESLLPEYNEYCSSLRDFVAASPTVLLNVATECEPPARASSISSYLELMYQTPRDACDSAWTSAITVASTYPATSDCPVTMPATSATPASAAYGTYPTYVPTSTGYVVSPSNGTSVPTSVPTGAATRPTGLLMGAAAVGGVLGAAVLL